MDNGLEENLRDINSVEDVKTFVDAFYVKVNKDDLLSPIFNDFAQIDWEHHMPQMYEFWSSVLFGTMSYKGRPFPKHARLPVKQQHFERWLQLFWTTIDQNFKGPVAEDVKQRAWNIAIMFQYKLGLIEAKQPE
jgi:hemoglobin